METPEHAAPAVYMFLMPRSVEVAAAVVIGTLIFAYIAWGYVVGGKSVLTHALYDDVRMRIRTRIGFAPLTYGAERLLDFIFFTFFLVTATIYVLQSMTQFAVGDPGPPPIPDPFAPAVKIPVGDTFWVANVFLLYLSLLFYKFGNAAMRTSTSLGWAALWTLIAVVGFLALIFTSAFDVHNVVHGFGRSLVEEYLLIAFAIVAFLYTLVQFGYRVTFSMALGDLKGPSGGPLADTTYNN